MNDVMIIPEVNNKYREQAEQARRRRIEELTPTMQPTALCVNFANESACNSCKWHNFTCTDSVIK